MGDTESPDMCRCSNTTKSPNGPKRTEKTDTDRTMQNWTKNRQEKEMDINGPKQGE